MATLTCAATLAGHTARVWDVQWNPTGSLLASCSGDKTVKVWGRDLAASGGGDGEVWVCKATLSGQHERTVRAISWSPCGMKLAAASFDGTATVWDRSEGGACPRLSLPRASIDHASCHVTHLAMQLPHRLSRIDHVCVCACPSLDRHLSMYSGRIGCAMLSGSSLFAATLHCFVVTVVEFALACCGMRESGMEEKNSKCTLSSQLTEHLLTLAHRAQL